MQKNDRVSFGSRIGAILAAAGSAVGLGNIWNREKFPPPRSLTSEYPLASLTIYEF